MCQTVEDSESMNESEARRHQSGYSHHALHEDWYSTTRGEKWKGKFAVDPSLRKNCSSFFTSKSFCLFVLLLHIAFKNSSRYDTILLSALSNPDSLCIFHEIFPNSEEIEGEWNAEQSRAQAWTPMAKKCWKALCMVQRGNDEGNLDSSGKWTALNGYWWTTIAHINEIKIICEGEI